METLAVRVHAHGGPEALSLDTIPVPDPGPGEILLAQTAIGLNFIDTYHRSGLYPIDPLPAVIGSEAAGIVEAVGEGVVDLEVGDRVAYALARGAYAEKRLVSAERVVRLPDGVSDEVGAAAMLKGLTAQYLLRRTYRVSAGDTTLVHAAAGGVGSILCQWGRGLGATVIGTAGSAEKAERARRNGCSDVILYRDEDVAERVMELTSGRGVDVVYDGVGKATFEASLASVKVHGMLVTFGNASGPVPPLDLLRLTPRGTFVTRPSLATYAASREDLERASGELFAVISDGTVSVEIGQRWDLRDVRAAHEALEARSTVGSSVLRADA